ncbi:thermonuclease family protein [Microbaculum marinum]|uniref:Thermonuclease family protein n=1 Tax=Microbaculum marinum TaxID=1764581 RepID=A0AAW9RU87_9HYPH
MIRVILTAVATFLVAAFVYGIVLNGFGLFSDWRPPDVAETVVPPAPGSDDPGVAGRGAMRAGPRPAQTDASGLAGSNGEATSQTAVRIPRDVTPPNVLARPTSRYVDPETVEQAEEEEDNEPDVRRYHRVIVRDAATLEAGDRTIRLAGISPVPGEKTCTDETGQTWPCGRVAAAALRMLIRHRAVDCTVVSEAGDAIVGTCSAGLQDINGWLVEQGWAEADPDAGYAEEADAARTQKRGVYLARWEVKGTGGSGLELPTSFTAPDLPPQPFQAPAFPSPEPDPPVVTEPLPQPEPSAQTPVEGVAD